MLVLRSFRKSVVVVSKTCVFKKAFFQSRQFYLFEALGKNSLYEVLGSTIRKVREARKMTQAQLGRSLTPQSTRASIANIEQGKQRVLVHTFVQLAKILESDMKDLLPAIEPAPASPSVQEVERELSRKLNLAAPQLRKLARATSSATARRKVQA